MTAKMGGCFRRFLEDADTQHFWRSINEITEALKKEQDILFKCEIFMSKKLKKNYIIVCKKYFCKFLIGVLLSNDRRQLFPIWRGVF